MKKKAKVDWKEPRLVDTDLYLDEYGNMYTYPSPNHDNRKAAVVILRKDYEAMRRLLKPKKVKGRKCAT